MSPTIIYMGSIKRLLPTIFNKFDCFEIELFRDRMFWNKMFWNKMLWIEFRVKLF
jgi:hypothetical protein